MLNIFISFFFSVTNFRWHHSLHIQEIFLAFFYISYLLLFGEIFLFVFLLAERDDHFYFWLLVYYYHCCLAVVVTVGVVGVVGRTSFISYNIYGLPFFLIYFCLFQSFYFFACSMFVMCVAHIWNQYTLSPSCWLLQQNNAPYSMHIHSMCYVLFLLWQIFT